MQISEEVLAALSLVDVNLDGHAVMPQLDRKLYLQVNKVLEACGFTWSRKAKAHITGEKFGDAYAKLSRVVVLGEVETDADLGFFATPPALARELVEMAGVERGDHALEPSAGMGAICVELFEAGAVVTAIEREISRRDELRFPPARSPVRPNGLRLSVVDTVEECDDFMEYQSDDWFDRVVMNPPFCKVGRGDHLDHVQHAYENFLKPGGVLVSVLPQGVMFRKDKRHVEFRAWVQEHGGAFVQLPDDAFKSSGTNVRTVALRMEGREW